MRYWAVAITAGSTGVRAPRKACRPQCVVCSPSCRSTMWRPAGRWFARARRGSPPAAARATLAVYTRDNVCDHLHRIGTRLLHGLHEVQRAHSGLVSGVAGIAEMCFLHYATEALSRAAAQRAAQRGLLFKRTAYNFVPLAHDEGTVDRTLEMLHESLRGI